MSERVCGNCKGEGWVEDERDRRLPSDYVLGSDRRVPCPVCQPEIASARYMLGIVSWQEAEIVNWLEIEAKSVSPEAQLIYRGIAKRIEAGEYLSVGIRH